MPGPLLIIDDEPDIREGIGDALLARGYDVLLARDGRDALAVARRTHCRPSVIVLDLVMPEMDGRTFLERLLQDPALRDVPVVVITAVEPTPRDFSRNVAAVFPKPLPLAGFLAEVSRIVEADHGFGGSRWHARSTVSIR